ncbi:4-hydroxy-tetrahydrodipicolinate reductase [Desulfocicer vacuolatum DSM 3385]|uniref:4-hydroxy-tetrahydrodipicolinate reductase n=1 Tax=Desulfocicer vacuolatum DSM 3385 TaxID=1121400 RepID=A0A1W2E2V3_9BACT|nr:dihydrodipicolinate reductase [Desulfocicer vacuolatum]SMD04073.1 4-hydroxy-tetrahydrodipicolinate reductase [Desulfocicer vacuolatum DSM 3385]
MEKIHVMMNGIPGNVVTTIAGHIQNDPRFELLPFAMTGPEITAATHTLGDMTIKLITPDNRDTAIKEIKEQFTNFICIDFTHPTAVNDNAKFYVDNEIPFVMGTTGGDRTLLEETILSGNIPAVIAPNMAKQIVGFQAMMEYAATTFPDLFKGYSLSIKESHQQTKADTSGTAKAMVGYFNRLGTPFSNDEIHRERDPEIQRNEWKIPEQHINGHAWHTYTLTSPDNTVCFEFSHNINGRDVYAQGTMDAAAFLHSKLGQQKNKTAKGEIYTMIDVLKGK